MKFKRIKETCIYMKDLAKAKSFYHDLLGLTIIGEQEGKHIFFRAGDSVLLCFNPSDSSLKKSPPPHYSNGPYHFAFEVSRGDYEQCKTEIQKKGIGIIDEVKWKDGVESFYFNDPGGNVVEIVAEGLWD